MLTSILARLNLKEPSTYASLAVGVAAIVIPMIPPDYLGYVQAIVGALVAAGVLKKEGVK